MADVVYNPLLKRNIQYLGGDSGDVDAKIAALQNAINDLQSRLNDLKNTKITKVTAAAQLSDLTNGEIFEWQTTTTQQFTQGYFYKKSGNTYTRVDLQPNYSLPTAAADVLGGVKVGQGLSIDNNGVLSAAAGDNLKIPRCFSQAQIDALSDEDIFQWQAASTTDYTNGYFYKKTGGTTVEVVAGSKYLFVSPAVDFGQYSIKAGYYTFVENTNITTVTGSFTVKGIGDYSSFLYLTYQPVAVGNKACKYVESTEEFVDFVEITAVDSNNIPSAMSDGATTINRSHSTPPYSSVIAKYQNINTLDVVYCVCIPFGSSGVNGVMLVDIINNVIYPIKTVKYLERTATEDITVSTVVISRVDTQPNSPYSLPIAAANVLGGVKVGNNLSIDANGVLSASGSSYTLPIAAANVLGGVKVGSGLSIDANGVLSSSGGGISLLAVPAIEKYFDIDAHSSLFVEVEFDEDVFDIYELDNYYVLYIRAQYAGDSSLEDSYLNLIPFCQFSINNGPSVGAFVHNKSDVNLQSMYLYVIMYLLEK